ncbi:unnamed protein product [Cylindrotheca closterium]|uniref:WW domain-containing protein n=1 Tax=Cylindrotheca closterium TaxID=2856 RepID=A0AAD2PU51_9STRA|nr:unnamed protein product [Cylindrotheca closterium]
MKKRKVLTKIDGNCLSKITRSIGTDPKVLGGRGLVLGSVRGSKTPRTSNLSDGLTKGQWIENNSQCGEKKRFPEEREGKANEFSASRNGTLSFRNRCNQLQYDQVKENNNFKIIGDTEARKGQWKPTLRNERGTMQTLPSAKGYFDQNIGSESDFRIARYVEKDKLSSHEVQHDYFKSSARQGDVHGRLDGHRSFRRSLNATIPSNCTIGSKLPGQFESTEESELAVSSPCRIRSAKWNLQGREYEPQYKSNANSTQPSHGGYFTKSSKSTASIDSKEIEAQNTDYQLQVWSVEGNPSSPLHLKIDGKIYLHPQLPSGWEIIVSETQKRPFYVHPDFGSTWHCPIILPRKVLKKNQGDVDVVMEKDAISADHTTTKRKQRNVVNRAPIQKKRLEKSMSELVTSYESEKRYPDDTPIDDLKRQIITGGYGISQTMDVEDSSQINRHCFEIS